MVSTSVEAATAERLFGVSAHPGHSLQYPRHVYPCEGNRAKVVLLPVLVPFLSDFATILLSEAMLALRTLRPVVDSHGSYAVEGLAKP